MRVLTRYVTVEFLRTLGASFVAFLLMFVMIDFLERVDGFVQRGAPLQTTISYFLNRIPDLVFEIRDPLESLLLPNASQATAA